MKPAAITTGQHFIEAFSWMLIHSLWQGLLLAVVAALLLGFNKKATAVVRYNLVLTQLLLLVLACGVTFLYEWYKPMAQYGDLYVAGALQDNAAASLKSFMDSCVVYFTVNSPVIVLLWFIMFLLRSVRMMGEALFISRARHRFIYQPAEEWTAKVNLLCTKLQLKRSVQLLESAYVSVPMVIGHLKPLILIPIGLLSGLPAGQVEAVLLHELAHIRRNDYLVNFLQTVAETIFFFNPGLLWISSVLRDERENCCDDIALAQTRDKKEFVQALISFKEYALKHPAYAVTFPGRKNSLLNRVSRILYNKNKALGTSEKVFFMAGMLLLAAIVATASITQIHMEHEKKAHNVVILQQKTAPPVSAVHTVAFRKRTHVKRKAATVRAFVPGQSSIQKKTQVHQFLATQQNNPAPQQRMIADIEKEMIAKREELKQASNHGWNDQEQARRNQAQAIRDQQQAKIDQEQAIRDQEQARKDQEQAVRDQQQAKKDQEQAVASAAKNNQVVVPVPVPVPVVQTVKKEEVVNDKPLPPF